MILIIIYLNIWSFDWNRTEGVYLNIIMVAIKISINVRRIVRRRFRREWCLDLKICLGDPYKGDAVSSPQKKQ